MLRLRRTIERAAAHRWLGFAVVALVVVLLAFLVLHLAEHALLGPTSLVCALIAVAFAVRLGAGPAPQRAPTPRRSVGRAPPPTRMRHVRAARPLFVPLRA